MIEKIDVFKKLVNYIGEYYNYTNEDKREIWDCFKLDPDGVIKALEAQKDHVNNLVNLNK